MIKLCRISLAVSFALASHAGQSQILIAERNLSFNAADEAAHAALEQCRKNGFRVTVTVLDRYGRTRVVLHDDGASPHTIENSLRKTYTALTFRQPSGDAGKRFTANPAGTGFLSLQNVTTIEGGLPILAGTEVVGSIGISGAPSGDRDALCAQAGIDRIAKGLSGS
ncbi:MAG: hypothetical protein JWQ23_1679 [Herminiimonas sp.]|nr:hypothetical protein [Herminiimonas sp.]